MERYKITSKGYRFDKVIFYLANFYILLILSVTILKYGLAFKPYINCITDTCENPFMNKNSYGCTFGFGLFDCEIQKEEWMKNKILLRGEYGTPPPNFNWFYITVFSALLVAFSLNHIIHNINRQFHINAMDLLEKINLKEEENEGENENINFKRNK